ncbi:MAG: AMP-binding protein [Pseudonocardia sp.]
MRHPLLPALADPTDRPALRFTDGSCSTTLTYAGLAGAAGALAGKLSPSGRVAVVATPTLHTAVAVTAALLAGAPAVPLNPKLGARELAHVLGDAGPDVLLTPPGTELDGPLAALPRADVDLTGTGPVPAAEPDPEQAALLVYTSGTTGPPKGAVLSRRALAANVDALAEAWEWTGEDVLAHALPLFHVHGLVLGVIGVLRRGGSLHHLGTLGAQALAAAVEAGATMVFGVPTQYHRLAAELEADPAAAKAVGRARLLVSGSAALTAVDHERLRRATGLAVRERYGLTETLILTAARAAEDPEPGTVGRPLTGTEVRLVPITDGPDGPDGPDGTGDADGTGGATSTGGAGPDGPAGQAADGLGAVEARSPGLFSGYLNRPDATAGALTPDGWFVTGDIGRWTESGALAIVGRRATDLIKSGGYKIGAGEIENALLEHSAVAECAVVGIADEDLGERIVAYVVTGAAGAVAPEELIEHVAALLAPHKRPREVRFVAELPRNDMGKVMKARLPR